VDDLNDDGRDDLAFVNGRVLLGRGDGTFAGDFDGDGP